MITSESNEEGSGPHNPSNASGGDRGVVVRNNSINSRELFAQVREINIAHGDEIYRLRITAQNKLILTK